MSTYVMSDIHGCFDELQAILAKTKFSESDKLILAGDLIERLVQAVRPKHALVTAPTFSEYPAALRRVGCTVREYTLSPVNGFHLTGSFLEEITEETELVFLCEPNNPTGVTTEPDLLLRTMERCDQCGALLAVDECFNALLSDFDSGIGWSNAELYGCLLYFYARAFP